MINIPPIRPTEGITTEQIPDIVKTWKVGRVLNATVETPADIQGKVLLRIGNQLVEGRTPVSLQQGESVKLLVKQLGDTPLLSILGKVDTQETAAKLLREFINATPRFNQLAEVATRPEVSTQLPDNVKVSLEKLVKNLAQWQSLTDGKSLQQLVKSSGVLFESSLAHNTAPQTSDLKASLFELVQTLQRITGSDSNTAAVSSTASRVTPEQVPVNLTKSVNAFIQGKQPVEQLVQALTSELNSRQLAEVLQFLLTPQSNQAPQTTQSDPPLLQLVQKLLQHIQQMPAARQTMDNLVDMLQKHILLHKVAQAAESTLHSMTAKQLIPVTQDTNNLLLLLFTLPVRDGDYVHEFNFRIAQEARADEPQNNQWQVEITFNLPTLGNMKANLHLVDERISVRLSAAEASTVRLINDNIQHLQHGLTRAGFSIAALDVSQDRIAPTSDLPPGVHLLDERA